MATKAIFSNCFRRMADDGKLSPEEVQRLEDVYTEQFFTARRGLRRFGFWQRQRLPGARLIHARQLGLCTGERFGSLPRLMLDSRSHGRRDRRVWGRRFTRLLCLHASCQVVERGLLRDIRRHDPLRAGLLDHSHGGVGIYLVTAAQEQVRPAAE